MSTSNPTADTSTQMLELMKLGDDAFNERDLAGMEAAHHPEIIAHIVGSTEPVRGQAAHAASMQGMFRAFPDVHVHNSPYPVQFAAGDWTTEVTRATGTFTGELVLPDGTVIPGTGKAFDLDIATTARWDNGVIAEEYVFWDSAAMAQQIGLG